MQRGRRATPCPGQGVENVRDDGGACEDLGQGLDIEMQSDPKLTDIQIESVLTAVKGRISKEYTTEQCLKNSKVLHNILIFIFDIIQSRLVISFG